MKNIFRSIHIATIFMFIFFLLPLQVHAAYGLGDAVGDAFTGTEKLTDSELEAMLKEPQLNIKLPGLEAFSKANVENLTVEDDDGNQYLTIPYAGDYIAAVYRFAVAATAIIAIIMIVFAGFQWMTSAGNSDAVTKAKSRIEHSLIGILLAVGSYLFLYTINPNLVEFRNLKVLYVQAKNLDEFEEVSPDFQNFAQSGTTGATIAELIGANPHLPCSKEAAQTAATKLHNLQICVGPCHCAYSASKFLQYIGCTDVYHGMANTLPKKLEEKGWKTITITEANRNSLPVGLLWKDGHVGVSIGDGLDFESGGWMDFKRFKDAGCPESFVDAMKNPQACAFCGKIPKEAPWSGHFGAKRLGGTGGGDKCESNQGWSQGKISDWKGKSAWKTLTTPFLK